MTKQLEECDGLLLEKAKGMINDKQQLFQFQLGSVFNKEFWQSTGKSDSQLKQRKESFGSIIELLQLSYIHNLKKTRAIITDRFIGPSMRNQTNLIEMQDLYDMQVITTMVELALPFEKDDIHYEINEDGSVDSEKPVFYFDALFECRDELQKLSLDEINNNKGMLVWVISSHMERRVNKLLREKNKSLENDKEYLEAHNRTIKRRAFPDGAPQEKWVSCSACGKWRMLPPDISAEEVEALPQIWTCVDNRWDPERSNCNAPEREARFMVIHYDRVRREEEQRMATRQDLERMLRMANTN